MKKEQNLENSTGQALTIPDVSNAKRTVCPKCNGSGGWTDKKGRQVEIHTMSDKWLNNIRKKFKGTDKVKPILAEINRRKIKRNGR